MTALAWVAAGLIAGWMLQRLTNKHYEEKKIPVRTDDERLARRLGKGSR